MTVNLSVGFQNLTNSMARDAKDKTYGLLVADTVRVTSSDAVALTDAPLQFRDISFFLKVRVVCVWE